MLAFESDSSKLFTINRYTRTPIALNSMLGTLAGDEASHAAFTVSVNGVIVAGVSAAVKYNEAVATAAAPFGSVLLSGTGRRIGEIEALIQDANRTWTQLPPVVTELRAEISAKISTRASIRAQIPTTYTTLATTITSSMSSSLSTAISQHQSIAATMTSERNAAVTAVQQQLSTVASVQLSRIAPQTSAITAQTSATASTYNAQLSTALPLEAVRADAACNSSLSGVSASPPQNTGTTDYVAWFVW